MRKRTIVGAVVLALLLWMGVTARVQAATVGCGSVITSNTTLTANVGPCAKGGFIIRGNNVTLDLGGFAVFGKSHVGDGVGVLFDHVTGSSVTHGTVQAFDAGVEVLGGTSNTVQGITATGNIGGSKSARNLGDGITVQQSSNNTVTGNTVTNNGPFSGISIVNDASNPSVGSNANTISNNQVVNNNVVATGSSVDQDDGIRIEGPNATNTTVQNNTVRASGLDGVAIFADQLTGFPNSGTVVDGNTISGNGFHSMAHRKGNGIILFGAPGSTTVMGANDTHVMNNSVTNNAANGILVLSLNNDVVSNTSTGNVAYPGVTGFDMADNNTNPPCDANTWLSNTFGTRNQVCIN